MATEDQIRTITIKAQTEGFDDANKQASQLADSMGMVAEETDSVSKSAINASGAYDRLLSRIDPTYRSTQQLAQAHTVLTKALDQGVITQAQYADALDKATKKFQPQPVNAFQAAIKGVQGQLVALSAGLGPVGVALAGLGPWGLGAAAVLGGVVKSFEAARDAAVDFARKAQGLQSFSITTGLTTDQIQKLNIEAAKFGINGDAMSRAIDQFDVRLNEVRRSQGPYFDLLREINPELAKQAQSAKTTADELNILAAAYAQAGEKGGALLQAAAGRGAQAIAPVLQSINGAGGVGNLSGKPTIANDEVKKLADALAGIEATSGRVQDKIANWFSESVLSTWQRGLDLDERIVDKLQGFTLTKAWNDLISFFNSTAPGRGPGAALASPPGSTGFVPNLVPTPAYPPQLNLSGIAQPAQQKTTEDLQSELNVYREMVSAIGAAATAHDQYNLRIKELDLSLSKHIITEDQYKKAVSAEGLQYAIQMESQRNSILGAGAPLTDLLKQKQDELNAARQRGVKITADEQAAVLASVVSQKMQADTQILVANGLATADQLRATKMAELNTLYKQHQITLQDVGVAMAAYEKTVEDTIKQQEILKAQLPGLKQLEIESGSLRTQLDTTGTSIANGISSDFVDLATHAKNTGDAFKDMGLVIIKAIDEMVAKMLIAAPIAKGLQAILGAFLPTGGTSSGGGLVASANGNVFSNGRLVPFASGGVISSPTMFGMADGRTGIMAEAGDEAIMPLARGPGGKLGVVARGAGGGDIHIHFAIDARGATQGVADQIVARAKAEILPQIIPLVIDAKDRRVRGL